MNRNCNEFVRFIIEEAPKHNFIVGDLVKIHCKDDSYDSKIGEVTDVFTNILRVRVGALPFPYKFNEVEFIAHGRVDNPVTDEEPKHEFKPFDKVLVKDNSEDKWVPDIFRYYDNNYPKDYPYRCCANDYKYCIPYEGNERLVGTTDKPE